MEKILSYSSIIFFIGLIAMVAAYIAERKNKKATPNQETKTEQITNENTENMPYKKKLLLTKNEWAFYKELKIIADEMKLTVLAKIRVADLVEVDSTVNKGEWQKYFNKINKKHIDFALANPANLRIELLIELDDNSHNENQKYRDKFVDELYKKTGYLFVRTRGTGDLKERITAALNINKQLN